MGHFRSSEEQKAKPIVGFILSLSFHTAAILGLVLISAAHLFPEGNLEGDPIDFAVIPQGNQVKTTAVTEIPVVGAGKGQQAKPQDFKAAARPKAHPVEAKKGEIPVKLPNKPVVAVAEAETVPEESTDESEVVVPVKEETHSVNEEFAEAPVKPEVQERIDVEEKNLIPAPVPQENKVHAEEESADSVPSSAVKSEAVPVAKTSESAGANALASGEGEAEKSNQAFGVPTGYQNVLSLKQRPGNRPPQYPVAARRAGEQGMGKLAYYVTKDGRVENLKIVQSTGSTALDNEALSAIAKYRFQAGQEGWTMHEVNFSLKGNLESAPSRLRLNGNVTTSSRDESKGLLRTRSN